MADRDRSNRYRGTVTAEEAESLLKPLVTELLTSHQEALSFWHSCLQVIPRLGLDDSKNQARARVISNFIASDVKSKFTGREGVSLTEDSGFVVLVIKEKIAVRFKKLDGNLRPSNIRTKQQYNFSTQALLPGFPPEATNLTFGHKLNSTGTDFEGFWLQCPRGDRNVWSIPLDKPADQPLFSVIQTQHQDPTPPVVRPKKTNAKKLAE